MCKWCGIQRRGWRRWFSKYCDECGPAFSYSHRPPCPKDSRRELKNIEVGLLVYGVHVYLEADKIVCALDVTNGKGSTEPVVVVKADFKDFTKMGATGFTKIWT